MSQRDSRVLTILLVTSIAAMVAALLVVRSGGTGQRALLTALVLAALGVIIVLAIVAAAASTARRRRQQADTQRVVEQLGLQYEPKSREALHRRFAPMPGIPRSGTVAHVLRGDLDGREFIAFQHMYMVHTGQASVPVHHTVYTTAAPQWPCVTVRPRGVLSRLVRRFGAGQSFVLEDPAFNHAFRVVTDDEDFALLLLHPQMQQFMMSHRKVSWQVNPGAVAMVYPGTMKFDRISASIDRLRSFWQLVPDELDAW